MPPALFNEAITVNARLSGWQDITVPKRASNIPGVDAGASTGSPTPALAWSIPGRMWAPDPFLLHLREGRLIYDLWESTATGQRADQTTTISASVACGDSPYGWLEKCLDFATIRAPKIDEYEKLINQQSIFNAALRVWGVTQAVRCDHWSLSGPMLAATGLECLGILRKVDHYELLYDDFEWDVGYRSRRRLLTAR